MTSASGAESAFADRLKAAREQAGLSQQELAQKADLQPSAVSHFETGTRRPSFDNLRRLARALDVTTDYLLGLDPSHQRMFRKLQELSEGDQKVIAEVIERLSRKEKE